MSSVSKLRLSGVLLRNFRAYEKAAFFPLRPVTLVFGENSAGKSTPLLALNLLRNSMDERSGYLNTSGGSLNIGGAKSLPHKRNPQQESETAIYIKGLHLQSPNPGNRLHHTTYPDIYSEYIDDNDYDLGLGVIFRTPSASELKQRGKIDERARIRGLRVYVGQSIQHLAEFRIPTEVDDLLSLRMKDTIPLRCSFIDVEHPIWLATARKWGALLCTLIASQNYEGRNTRATEGIGLYDHTYAEEHYPALNRYDDFMREQLKNAGIPLFNDEEFLDTMVQHLSKGSRSSQKATALDAVIELARNVTVPDEVILELARSIAYAQKATSVGINSWSPSRHSLVRADLRGHPLMDAFPGGMVPNLNLSIMMTESAQSFRSVVRDVHIVAAERESIGRISLFSRSEQPDSVGSLLSATANEENSEWSQLEQALKVAGIGYEFQLERWSNPNDPESGAFAVKIREEGMPGSMNIVDHGLGLQKVLPVLSSSLIEKHKAIAIQEPETHLHPQMQKSVATFLAIAARNRVGPVFVETHSEHILRRILAHIGSGKMQPQLSEAEVAILYVTRVNGSSTVTQLEIAPNGTMATPWPNESANDGYRELLT